MMIEKSKDFLNFAIGLLNIDTSKVNDIKILEQFVSVMEKEALVIKHVSKFFAYYSNKAYEDIETAKSLIKTLREIGTPYLADIDEECYAEYCSEKACGLINNEY